MPIDECIEILANELNINGSGAFAVKVSIAGSNVSGTLIFYGRMTNSTSCAGFYNIQDSVIIIINSRKGY